MRQAIWLYQNDIYPNMMVDTIIKFQHLYKITRHEKDYL